MRNLLSLALLLAHLTVSAQDTLTFGGIYDLPGAEVRATARPVSALAQRFTIEEVYRLPGTFYDPARLVALLPGVVQTNDQANHLSVRGNTPNANLWRLNGQAIVNPNHTANAGTFYDFPTLSGGGVNAISAQMLDNSGFLAGGLPVEYGYAGGGTFDLRLRPGSKTGRRYQAQAGFIGFDLSAEASLGPARRTSYLVNSRYSFTGLLADLGADFGGESIRFADLNAHLHRSYDRGEWSVFLLSGGSSNVFRYPEGEEITEQKELFDIEFNSFITAAGFTFSRTSDRGKLRGGISASAVNNDRFQRSRNANPFLEATQRLDQSVWNLNLIYDRALGDGATLTVGTEVIRTAFEGDMTFATGGPERTFRPDVPFLSPSAYAAYGVDVAGGRLTAGLRVSYYDVAPAAGLEGFAVSGTALLPSLAYRAGGKGARLTLTADRVLNRPPLVRSGLDELDDLPVTNRLDLRYRVRAGAVTLGGAAFGQYTPDELASLVDGQFLLSANNLLEVDPNLLFDARADTRRYGLELEAAGGRRNAGWYYRGSLTLLRAETQQSDNEWERDRFGTDFITKLTLGREWTGTDRKDRPRTNGLNLALIAHGGEYYGEVTPPAEGDIRYFTPPNYATGFGNDLTTYFRPDLRLYRTIVRSRTTNTLALDIQNAANVRNVSGVYYDEFLGRPNERLQLGLIPVLSYRIVWR